MTGGETAKGAGNRRQKNIPRLLREQKDHRRDLLKAKKPSVSSLSKPKG
ncbi:MAG: hypothetical protein HY593_02385 [Candidatus Omnitrophica bacterium]|nr:hypothetical protein [Candidatus Omnitrophota bacterium]